VSVCRLSEFDDERSLSFVSCLQIAHDAIYFTYQPLRTSSVWDTVHHHVHAHGVGIHDPPDVVLFPVVGEDMEDGFQEDEWEDDESEDEGPVGFGAGVDGQSLVCLSSLVAVLIRSVDPVNAIINNWFLPTSSNTVFSVSF